MLRLCQTTLDGTTPDALADAARQLELTVAITYDDPTVLSKVLSQQKPVLVFLGIPASTFSREINIHAVVVTQLKDKTINFIDPTDGLEHSQERNSFFAHWQDAFHTAINITPA